MKDLVDLALLTTPGAQTERHTDLENKLKAALTGVPPPSLADLYKRYGTSQWIVGTKPPTCASPSLTLTGGYIRNWIAMRDAVADARKDYETDHRQQMVSMRTSS